MYIKVLEYLCKAVLTISFQEAATHMSSVKNVFWKFQEILFKNNCDWAFFLQLPACNFTKNKLLHKSFQRFSLDYQNILFPEKLFMGHSWQRVANMLWRPPYIAYPPLKNFVQPLYLLLPTFTSLLFLMSCFFDWMGNRATFDVISINILWIYKCRALVP